MRAVAEIQMNSVQADTRSLPASERGIWDQRRRPAAGKLAPGDAGNLRDQRVPR